MFLKLFKRLKKVTIILVIFALVYGIQAIPMHARSCEEAFFLCWDDYHWMSYIGVVYCGVGYMFCKKYVQM